MEKTIKTIILTMMNHQKLIENNLEKINVNTRKMNGIMNGIMVDGSRMEDDINEHSRI